MCQWQRGAWVELTVSLVAKAVLEKPMPIYGRKQKQQRKGVLKMPGYGMGKKKGSKKKGGKKK